MHDDLENRASFSIFHQTFVLATSLKKTFILPWNEKRHELRIHYILVAVKKSSVGLQCEKHENRVFRSSEDTC